MTFPRPEEIEAERVRRSTLRRIRNGLLKHGTLNTVIALDATCDAAVRAYVRATLNEAGYAVEFSGVDDNERWVRVSRRNSLEG